MVERVPLLAPLADRLEAVFVGRFRRQYRWVVRALTALSALLVAVSAVLLASDAGVDASRRGHRASSSGSDRRRPGRRRGRRATA